MINQEKLLAALTALNTPPVPFTLENVVLSPPTSFPGPNPWNTRVTISAVPAKGYSSGLDFYYHRIDLAELGDLAVVSAVPVTVAGILLVLNNANAALDQDRAELDVSDLEEITLPRMYEHGDATFINLTARANSYGWCGENNLLVAYNLPDVSELETFLYQTAPGYFPG